VQTGEGWPAYEKFIYYFIWVHHLIFNTIIQSLLEHSINSNKVDYGPIPGHR
jgi:hypothetical protein